MSSSPSVASLRELIEQAACGDESAAREIFESYSPHLFRVIRRRFLPVWAPLRRDLDSIDLVQETWQTVFECLREGRRFLTPEEFTGFLLVTASNRFHVRYRARVKVQKRALLREEPLDPTKHDRPAAGADPAEIVANADAVAHCLAGMSERERTVLAAIGDGESLAKVAQRLGVSVRTVERSIRRARRSLAKGGIGTCDRASEV